MEYLTKQASMYGLNIRAVLGRFNRVSYYEVISKDEKVLANIHDVNEAYWLQRDDNFMSELLTRKKILIIK